MTFDFYKAKPRLADFAFAKKIVENNLTKEDVEALQIFYALHDWYAINNTLRSVICENYYNKDFDLYDEVYTSHDECPWFSDHEVNLTNIPSLVLDILNITT